MKQYVMFLIICLACPGVLMAGGTYTPVTFYRDVAIGTWSSNSAPTVATSSNAASGWSSGSTNTYVYRISGTNRAGRLPVSGTTSITWTNTAALNAVTVRWAEYDGVQKYVVERATNAAGPWTNWRVVASGTTNWTDLGTNTWSTNVFTNAYSVIPAPSVPWASASGNFTGTVAGVAAATLTNQAAQGATAYGWGYDANYRRGMWATYLTSTSVWITAGSAMVNGERATPTNATHVLTSLAAGADYHYIYIDHAASTYPSGVVYVDATNEPSGRYYGSNLCVGAVYSPAASATLQPYTVNTNGGLVLWIDAGNPRVAGNLGNIADGLNPDGTWQTPTTESAVFLPVNASHAHLLVRSADPTTYCEAWAVSKENADGGTFRLRAAMGGTSWAEANQVGTVPLGPSRNVRILAADDDDNGQFDAGVLGYILYP